MQKPLALLLVLSALLSLPAISVDAKAAKSGASKKTSAAQAKRAKLLSQATYKEGLSLYQKRNYSGALKCFFKLDGSGFCCDLVHYYIGQCYQHTNQTAAAQQHYDWVVARSQDPTLRSYADYANQTMAYYNQHRTFAGQGNYFDKGGRAGPGGSAAPRQGFS
jgi:tetratricopeptide (TPR) repeat protein